MGEIKLDIQACGFCNHPAGGVGGADVMLGENTTVGNAKLYH
jgi:hypothetical protein